MHEKQSFSRIRRIFMILEKLLLTLLQRKFMHYIKMGIKKFSLKKLAKLWVMDMIFLLFLSLLLAYNTGFGIVTISILIILYLLLTGRKSLFYHFFVAFSISFIWVLIANERYGYADNNAIIFGLNIFPMFAFTVGLLGTYMIYSHFEKILKKRSFIQKLLLFAILYWVLLIFAESIGYHVFGISNIANANYQGLPFCNCLHAPYWMQAAYFLIGPLFFSICSFLRFRNPHTAPNVKPHLLKSLK